MADDHAKLAVRLTPKASSNKIDGFIQDENGQNILKVSVTAVPEKGKANKALIDMLAKQLKVPKSAINLVKGETDRNKLLLINGVSDKILQKIMEDIENKR